MDNNKRLLNFSAGPCQLPLEVLEEVQRDVVNYKGWGLSVMEMSHRGPHFKQVLAHAKHTALKFLEVPTSHSLCFMAGGATAQFAAEALNLLTPQNQHAGYAITGHWSRMARKEALKFGEASVVTDASQLDYNEIEPVSKWNVNKEAAYLHYCDNETIHGLEFPNCPSLGEQQQRPLMVADLASNLGTRPIDWANIDLAYAGTQKNIGIAGATLVVVNRAVLDGRGLPGCPSVLSYEQMLEADSCLNTPPTFSIHVAGVTLSHLAKQGDLSYWDRQCSSKSAAVYRQCDCSDGFYAAPVLPQFRSRVSVRFNIVANETAARRELHEKEKREDVNTQGAACTPHETAANKDVEALIIERAKQADQELTKQFLKHAEANGIICINGHRSLGGLRACTYAGISTEHIEKLLHVMQEFRETEAVV